MRRFPITTKLLFLSPEGQPDLKIPLTPIHFQTMNSNALSLASLVTSTVNCSASLHTSTTHISTKSYTSALNPISTPCSPISWRLEESLIYWRSKKYWVILVPGHRVSRLVLHCCSKNGGKWVLWRNDTVLRVMQVYPYSIWYGWNGSGFMVMAICTSV